MFPLAAPVLEATASVVDKLARVHEVLGSIETSEFTGLSGSQQREAATSLSRLEARVTAYKLAAVAAVESSGEARRQGATSTASMLSNDFGGDRRGACGTVRRAKKIEQTPQSHEAMAQGRLSAKQARVIEKALDLLPEETPKNAREACETQLVEDAPRMDLRQLQRQADRVVGSFIRPESVDEGENDIVQAREQRAWNTAEFWMGAPIDGTVKGGFTIPEAQAAHLRVALEALCAPQIEITGPGEASRATSGVLLDERPSYGRRQGWAFAHLCELLPVDRLPETNNVGPIMTVNIDHQTLLDQLKVAVLSTGETLSAGQARRMACEHRILPAVFGGDSLPLDLGRDKRLYTLHQRRALELSQKGCVFPGCDRPPGWCVVHHGGESWAAGGQTDLKDGVLLCPHHHRILHTDGWDVHFTTDGIPELVPPASLDPRRRPRRHRRFP
ncbi:DUF222 domain-containing protein [Aeromicrobium sp. CTD01-1L150]|uniref:HNH endonuclease signature motif containing protein n=1 Tax=Aeromicrobium sp. CTD01-1L150 TaxID=3341830 RepID=UPI0035BFA7E3